MSNSLGTIFRFTVFGQSHAPAIGATIEGISAGKRLDLAELQRFLERRAPGRSAAATGRKEADEAEILCGLNPEGYTCGSPLTAIIRNTNTRSSDYSDLLHTPRPAHADYPAMLRYGVGRDVNGGGQFSGRLTAGLCIAGGIAIQLLREYGVTVSSRIVSVGGERDAGRFDAVIAEAKAEGDSVGGVIEVTVNGMPVGVGEPMFDGLENRIAQAVFGIPAVKGIEFGAGFRAAELRGSENNDAFLLEGESVRTETNRHGGILGGMSSGMPIVFRAAVKPTPSIAKPQRSVDLARNAERELTIHGRHDPCIVPRALPCMEAAAAVSLYDELMIYHTMTGEQ